MKPFYQSYGSVCSTPSAHPGGRGFEPSDDYKKTWFIIYLKKDLGQLLGENFLSLARHALERRAVRRDVRVGFGDAARSAAEVNGAVVDAQLREREAARHARVVDQPQRI
jgi:hypothetical protein